VEEYKTEVSSNKKTNINRKEKQHGVNLLVVPGFQMVWGMVKAGPPMVQSTL